MARIETADIPQRAVGVRVGQRGRIKTVPYPDCDYVKTIEKTPVPCRKPATVSIPKGATTTHRCTEHAKVQNRVGLTDSQVSAILSLLEG